MLTRTDVTSGLEMEKFAGRYAAPHKANGRRIGKPVFVAMSVVASEKPVVVVAMSDDAPAASEKPVVVMPVSRRRRDIDGLRLVACAAVVVNHMDESWLMGGFTGVDVFFVISGFVVTLSSTCKTQHLNPLPFYARRVRRLMPLSVATVLVTAYTMLLVLPATLERGEHLNDDAEAVTRISDAGLCSLVGWANNYLAIRSIHTDDNYWGEGRASSAFNPFTHFWSLGVEEQFYVLFPLLLAVWRKWRRAGTVALLCICAASLVLCGLHQRNGSPLQDAAFYLVYTRAWQLLAGVALTWPATHAPLLERLATTRAGRLTTHLLGLASFLLLGTSFAIAQAEHHLARPLFPLPIALPAVGGTASFILAGSVTAAAVPKPPSRSSAGGESPLPLLNRLLATPPCVYGGALVCAAP